MSSARISRKLGFLDGAAWSADAAVAPPMFFRNALRFTASLCQMPLLTEFAIDFTGLRVLLIPERLRLHSFEILAGVAEGRPHLLLVAEAPLLLFGGPHIENIGAASAAEDLLELARRVPISPRLRRSECGREWDTCCVSCDAGEMPVSLACKFDKWKLRK